MQLTREHTRRVQIVFLVLMAASATQVLWWILDQARHSRELHDRLRVAWAADQWAAQELLGLGVDPERVAQRYPHLALDARPIGVRAEILDELDDRRRSRLSQYGWEGSFFLLVLISGMAVVWRAVRQDAELHTRQQNFLAAVSHELKSPIASMQLTAETIALRDPPAERRQTLIRRLLADLERLGGLVTNLLEASRLQQARLPSNPERLGLRALASQTVEELAERADEAGVDLRIEIPDELELEADPLGVRTVLRNLLGNALEACRLANGKRIELLGDLHEGRVRLRICDQGVGFPPTEAKRLFEQFYRVGNELRRSSPGTGLGLYIVQRFMDLEGGRVRAESPGPGLGATLTVEWPAPAPSVAPTGSTETSA